MYHTGDLLLCQQNGNLLDGHTSVGLGMEGLNSFQQINALGIDGIGRTTGDDDYFKTYGEGFFQGTSELEQSLQAEMRVYQAIWENDFFLRVLTQVVRVANGDRYDWQLDMYHLGHSKSRHIQDHIIKHLDVCPKFKRAMETGYRRQIRNAVAHAQYHAVQGGIWLDNYKKNADEVQAIGFEEWERVYCYSYYIFIGIFEHLKGIVRQFYLPMTRKTMSGGIPVLCYFADGSWETSLLYPDKKGERWRFIKQE